MIIRGNYVLWILILLWPDVRTQFHLSYTDRTNNDDLYHDCLYYKVPTDVIIKQITKQEDFKKPYQIIPYCIRPMPETEDEEENNKATEGNISSQFTFEQLK